MNQLIRSGAAVAAVAVVLGAFGAHGLKARIDAQALNTWETAVQYQWYHALGILICGILYARSPQKQLQTATRLFLLGIVCFSGSLYLLSLRTLLPFNVLWLGPVTPAGGVLFIVGWLRLLLTETPKP